MLKAPPLQTATATIDTLCGRLQSATLLEDRRAAILGLRSFAKQFPASVASGSLRELILTLRRDGLGESLSPKGKNEEDGRAGQEGGDVDTIRLILETLLMLFNPDANSPEASDEIAYFMADEFSMRQENAALLLSLLDSTSPFADYYARLYSVQLLTAVCAARPERLQECILSAPLGVSRLVSVLDDSRDAVRNAGLLLLVELTGGANEELRKIIAFEDVFGRLFAMIRQEGSLSDAGIVAQDCLTLLANLIRGSASNQTIFRESGCVPDLVQLLGQALPSDPSEAAYMAQNRERAAWGLLQLLQLFFIDGEASTPQNQAAFFRAGTAKLLCELAFSTSLPAMIRAAALRTAAVLIEGNAPLQEQFAALQVVTEADAAQNASQAQADSASHASRPTNGTAKKKPQERVIQQTYIIEALLDLCLASSQADQDLRLAACGLIEAYLAQHERIKHHFLQRAIAGHAERETAANVLTALLHPSQTDTLSSICASWIVQGLVADNLDAKVALAAVQEGDEKEGEDVISSISALSSQLLASLQLKPADEKAVTAYASLLSVLLWDFAPGVDHLLADGSSLVQALIAAAKSTTSTAIVTGLAAVVLGTVYEFSTKDSPIPRRTLAPLLLQKLGRLNYLDALLHLRADPAVRDSGIEQNPKPAAEVFFSRVFVDLFQLEYTRLRKAIDKDPGLEVLPPSAVEAGVDRDVLDVLRQQIEAAKQQLELSQQKHVADLQTAEQERLAASRALQAANGEIEQIRQATAKQQKDHESAIEKIRQASLGQQKEQESIVGKITKEQEQKRQLLEAQHQRALAEAKQEAERRNKAALRELEAASAKKVQEYERRITELGNQHRKELRELEAASAKKTQEHDQQIAKLGNQHRKELGELEVASAQKTKQHEQQIKDLGDQHRKEAKEHAETRKKLDSITAKHDDLVTRERDANKQIQDLEQRQKTASESLEAAQAKVTELEAALEKAKATSEQAEAALAAQTKEREQLEAQNKELNEELKSREEELATERAGFADLEKELEASKKNLQTSKKELETSRKELEASKKELEAFKKEPKASKKSAKATADSSPRAEQLASLQAELQAAREGEKGAKDELESMLLLMSDMEAKQESYKAKVKELGGEVTDEEDEGDDEEDDAEEDDEEADADDDVD